MTDSNTALNEVPALLEERRKYEGWLSALEARRDSTPAHVFERVHNDYRTRLQQVKAAGQESAYLYGADDAGEYKRLNAFFLLTEEPEVYNLPPAPYHPRETMLRKYAWSAAVGLALSVFSAVILGRKK